MKSMTGFAQGRFEFENLSLNIVIKSLNHRFLDVSFKGTGINPTTEKYFKDIIKNRISRGKVEIIFDLFDSSERKCNIHFNEKLSTEILDKLLYFKHQFKDRITITMDSLLRIPMLFHLDYIADSYTEEDTRLINNSIEKVFDEFMLSREKEGQSIFNDILESIGKIETNLDSIKSESESIEKEIFLKFKEKITKYLSEYDIDERRIVQEAAIIAEKSCINEEISRISTHTRRLKELIMDANLDTKGKEGDFLAQEIQRETHTIASKTNSMEVHKFVLNIRREVEKIKQQVQNVE